MRRTAAGLLLLIVVLTAGCASVSLLQTVESLIQQAKELLDARRYDEALAKLFEALRRDPTQWKAYLYTAQAYIGKQDWTAALTNARKALELAPADATVVAVLGDAIFGGGLDALKRGAFADAGRHFVEYIKLRPADPAGYLNAGRAYLGGRNWTEAVRVLVEGLGRTKDSATRVELARTLLDGGRQAVTAGEHRGAIALLREYVRAEPGDVAAYLELGKAYWNAGDRSDALAAFRRVLELASSTSGCPHPTWRWPGCAGAWRRAVTTCPSRSSGGGSGRVRPIATTWRLYDGSALGGRPLIAHGAGAREPVVLNEATWLEIRKRTEEVA